MSRVVTARRKSALAWGVVGALAFLVLHQGYLLLDGRFLGVGPVAAIAVVVFGATTGVAYLAEARLAVARGGETDACEGR